MPEKLAPIYAKKFLEYYDANPKLGIECFGLNCAPPEAILDSLHWMFNKVCIRQISNPNKIQDMYFFLSRILKQN